MIRRRSVTDCDQVARESGQQIVETIIDWENNKYVIFY